MLIEIKICLFFVNFVILVCNIILAVSSPKISPSFFLRSNLSGLPHNETIELLKNLKYFFDPILIDKNMFQLQELLHKYFEKKGKIDIHGILKMLSPQCSEFIKNCTWGGQFVDCNETFILKAGTDQFCCFISNNTRFSVDFEKRFQKAPGLEFYILFDKNDVLFDSTVGSGAHVQLANFGEFVDRSFGGLREIFVSEKSKFYFQVEIEIVEASKDISVVPLQVRKCWILDNTHNKCVFDCKVKAIFKTCGCIPFLYIPYTNLTNKQCTIIHSECLYKYKKTFETISFVPDIRSTDEINDLNSIKCKCYPSCSESNYNLISDFDVLYDEWSNNVTYSIVNIYLNKPMVTQYLMDVQFHWYDLVSAFGGLMSMCFGASFISIYEIFFFFIVRFSKNIIQ